jgi:hypothetical protein
MVWHTYDTSKDDFARRHIIISINPTLSLFIHLAVGCPYCVLSLFVHLAVGWPYCLLCVIQSSSSSLAILLSRHSVLICIIQPSTSGIPTWLSLALPIHPSMMTSHLYLS